jgi:hypothetical protein
MERTQSQWLLWVATALAFAVFTAPAWTQRPPGQVRKGTRIKGNVVRVQGNNQFVVRTADNREVILFANPQTKFLLENRAARFTDLRTGVAIDALYDVTGDQNFASSVTITPAVVPGPGTEAEVVEGTIVRVLEADNQVVVRTAAGKEVIVFTDTRTTFTFDNRTARLADFRVGTPVRVNVHMKDRKHFARSMMTMPRRPR